MIVIIWLVFRFLSENQQEGCTAVQQLRSSMSSLESCDPVVFYKVLNNIASLNKLGVASLQSLLKETRVEILEPSGTNLIIL